jgi:hypothetical protein
VYDRFGETVVQNVCTYEEVRIPWGVGGWFSFVAVTTAIFVIVLQLFTLLDGE